MTRRPTVVFFDVVETLFSLAPVETALAPLGVSVELYFARLLRDGFALAAAGDYQPFFEIAASALATLAPAATYEQRERVQKAFTQLPAHPDAEPALAHQICHRSTKDRTPPASRRRAQTSSQVPR